MGQLARFAVVATLGVLMFALSAIVAQVTLHKGPFGIDLLPAWVAAHDVRHAYDFAAITQAQGPELSGYATFWQSGHAPRLRPFVWPPSALLILSPLAVLPFAPMAGLLSALSIAANAFAAWRANILRAWPVAMVLPVAVLAVCAGQTTLLVAALCLLVLTSLEARPIVAGLLLAVAAALKPQAVVLFPVALAAAGSWRALWVAALGFAVIALGAYLAFGWSIWPQWFAALGRFAAVISADPSMVRGLVSPIGMLPPAAQPIASAVALTVGAGLAWWTVRRTSDPLTRLAVLFGGAILASPYAFQYDAALLALPVAGWLTGARTWRMLAASGTAYVLTFAALLPNVGWLAIVPVTLLAGRQVASSPH